MLLSAAPTKPWALAGSWWAAAGAYLATAVVRDLTGPPFHAWLNGSITDSSLRATVLSLTSIASSAGEWGGGPALGLVGNRFGVRIALAVGAVLLLPTVGLFARGGLAAIEALRDAHWDVFNRRPRPSRLRLARAALSSLIR